MNCNFQLDDCFDFLGNMTKESAALVLTDPPYAISRKTGFSNGGGVERFAVSMDFGKWDAEEIDLGKFATAIHRVLKVGGTAIVWYDLWKLTALRAALESAGFRMFRLIIWEKTNPVPLNSRATYLSNSREIAVCCVKGSKPVFKSQYDNGVYSLPIPRHAGKRIHPTQKPLDLFEELVIKHSNKGDLVVDPFAGSCTTGVAALSNGRHFAGCENDRKYFLAARRRINAVKA